MTNKEAIASMKTLCHTCKLFPICVNDKPECFHAIEMAIKSLEAWEKVKEEINSMPNIIYRWDAVEIIDKHLAEMESEE